MKEEFDFYAYLMRMKYIKRWALMRSTSEENIMEHSWEVAVIAHALAIIKNEKFGGSVDEYKTLCLAVYHGNGSFMAGGNTKTAASTFFFIYLDNLSNHKKSPVVNIVLVHVKNVKVFTILVIL